MRAGVRGRATVAVGVVGVLAITGITGASAAPPPAGSTVELASNLGSLDSVLIADDAVYFSDTPNATAAVYRQALTTGASGTALGAAEIVGFGVGWGQLAEHDGTLAYTRGRDARLVLRAPDGTTTAPAWGASVDFSGGVSAMTNEWLVAVDWSAGEYGRYTLYDRGDGRSYDLTDLVDLPAQYTTVTSFGVVLTDTRVLWLVDGLTADESTELQRVYTVALGADGPTGTPVQLASSVIAVQGSSPYTYFYPLDVTGARVMWERNDCTGGGVCTTTANWYTGAPYTGAPQSAAVDGEVASVEGDTLTVRVDEGDYSTLEWLDLANPTVPIRSVDTGLWVRDVRGSLVAHSPFGEGTTHVSDAAGGAVTTATTLAPALMFTDVDWSDPFILEVQWMVGEGITTGYPDGTFRNTDPVTRAAMAAFLRRLVQDGDAPMCTEAAFADVPPGHPFCPDIAWLAGTGITTGWPDDTYRGSQPVTREAMAAFLYRLAFDGGDAPACTTKPFSDVTVDNPFCGEIAWLATTGVTTGWPDGTFRPKGNIARHAMGAFLYRFVDAGLLPEL